jgi:hypothetical protein
MDASGRLFQREGDGATTLLAIVARDRRSRSSSLCLLLADCDLCCAAGFLVSHRLGCGFFGGLRIFLCIGIYFSLFGSDLRKN